MNTSAELRMQLLHVVVELAKELPPATLNALISWLETNGIKNLDRFAGTRIMRERLRLLEELCGLQPGTNGRVVALAMRAAAASADLTAADHTVEIAWTGPATEAVPLRRVDQVLYDMIESAQEEILLVTYAAYRAERAVAALRDATGRGVVVKFLIELARESGGKITFDRLDDFRRVLPEVQFFYWSMDRRHRSAAGAYGAMHAKCLVADRSRALISSANLTDHALEVNMELGLVAGRDIARRLAEHFDQLILRGELIPADR